MIRMNGLVTVCALFVMTPLCVRAADPETALNGYCPVCLVKANQLVKGDPKISSVYDGKTYLFPSSEQKRMFDANPNAFAPALGGICTVCKVEMGKDVPGKAEFHSVRNDRLFLFASQKQKKMFDRSPGNYADADLALEGNCPVCLVKLGKVVPGKAEYASVYDGRRYLFPSPKQKRMFDANPVAFTPTLGGNCTVCKVEMKKDVPGKADFHVTRNGRLYLFPSAKQRDMFLANPDKYADADVVLGGNCSVCKIELGKDVPGNPDISVDYNGRRYLFPAEKQRTMFLANPSKYAAEVS